MSSPCQKSFQILVSKFVEKLRSKRSSLLVVSDFGWAASSSIHSRRSVCQPREKSFFSTCFVYWEGASSEAVFASAPSATLAGRRGVVYGFQPVFVNPVFELFSQDLFRVANDWFRARKSIYPLTHGLKSAIFLCPTGFSPFAINSFAMATEKHSTEECFRP